MDNLEEMDKFLERYNLPRLNQEEIENMNRPITSIEIETVIKNLPTKVQEQMASQVNSIKHLEKSLHPSFSNSSKNLQRKETLPNSFYEATITLMPKPDKDTTKKENYRPISLTNIDAKILNKILANRIQQHIKMIIHHD